MVKANLSLRFSSFFHSDFVGKKPRNFNPPHCFITDLIINQVVYLSKNKPVKENSLLEQSAK